MKTITTLVIYIGLLASCKTVYVPNMLNMPLLREQGEFRGNLSFNDLQLAYAPTPHLGLMANGFTKRGTFTDSITGGQQNGNGYLLEFGAGYFNTFHDFLSAEAFGGIGFGQVNHEHIDSAGATPRTFQASGLKLFVQPAMGLTSRFVDVGVTGRFAMVKFSNLQSTNYPDSLLARDGFLNLGDPAYTFFEPAVTLRAGYQWVKVFMQVGTSLKLNSAPLNYQRNFTVVGLHITVAPRYLGID